MSTATAARTSKTRTLAKTTEEKKAQAEALHQSITDQVEGLRDSGRWAAFLNFAQAFHAYSLNNVLLILSQLPEASQVAGFRKWQALNRQVRKGSKGIRIFGYSTKKVTEEDANGDEVEKKIARFPILSVFDISQTDLIDPALGDPSTLTTLLTGADDFGIVDALSTHLIGEGWTVKRQPLPSSMNGVTRPKEMTVVIDSDLSPEAAAKTMIHECAHILLGHIDDLAEYAKHRGLMETEAESIAYVVAGMAGFDTSAYSVGYIAGWAEADTDLIRSTAARVLRVAHQIAGILTPEDGATNPGRETLMIITYQRPDTIGDTLDPEAPPANLSTDGSECGAETVDVAGLEWRCTRTPHPGQDEHRAAYDRDGDGPENAVGLAWTYQYADTDQGGGGGGVNGAAPMHFVTVSFPNRAGGVDAEKIRTAILDLFWEGDADDIQITVTTS